jgi:hypothetical protein
MLVAKGITKEKMEIVARICGGTITKWKRKLRDEQELPEKFSSPPIQGGWKRRGICEKGSLDGEGTPFNSLFDNQNRSGMAEASEQPRRPQ